MRKKLLYILLSLITSKALLAQDTLPQQQIKPPVKFYWDIELNAGKTWLNAVDGLTKEDIASFVSKFPDGSAIQGLNAAEMTSVEKSKKVYVQNTVNTGFTIGFIPSRYGVDSAFMLPRITIGLNYARNNKLNTHMVNRSVYHGIDSIYGPNQELYGIVDSLPELRWHNSLQYNMAYLSLGFNLTSSPSFNLIFSIGACFDLGMQFNGRYKSAVYGGYDLFITKPGLNSFPGNADEVGQSAYGAVNAMHNRQLLLTETGTIKPQFIYRFSIPVSVSFRLSATKPQLKNMRLVAQAKYGAGTYGDFLETNLGLCYSFY